MQLWRISYHIGLFILSFFCRCVFRFLKKHSCKLTKTVRNTGIDLLILCLRPGVKRMVKGKSFSLSVSFPQISPGTQLELCSLRLSLYSLTAHPRSKLNYQRHQLSVPQTQGFGFSRSFLVCFSFPVKLFSGSRKKKISK